MDASILRDDKIIRVAAQIFLCLFILGTVGAAIMTVTILVGQLQRTGWAEWWSGHLIYFLTIPFKNGFATATTALAAAYPSIVTTICYKRVENNGQSESSKNLNLVGYIFLFANVLVALNTAIATLILQSGSEAISQIFANTADRTATLATTATLMSFHIVYVIQMLGLKAK